MARESRASDIDHGRLKQSTIGRELGSLKTQRYALCDQIVRIARCVLDEAVATPFLTGSGIVPTILRVTRASAGFHQSIR